MLCVLMNKFYFSIIINTTHISTIIMIINMHKRNDYGLSVIYNHS